MLTAVNCFEREAENKGGFLLVRALESDLVGILDLLFDNIATGKRGQWRGLSLRIVEFDNR